MADMNFTPSNYYTSPPCKPGRKGDSGTNWSLPGVFQLQERDRSCPATLVFPIKGYKGNDKLAGVAVISQEQKDMVQALCDKVVTRMTDDAEEWYKGTDSADKRRRKIKKHAKLPLAEYKGQWQLKFKADQAKFVDENGVDMPYEGMAPFDNVLIVFEVYGWSSPAGHGVSIRASMLVRVGHQELPRERTIKMEDFWPAGEVPPTDDIVEV